MAASKHQQIRDWIESEILRGTFSVGQKLPTESDLMERFEVSRNPVQKAMSNLVEAGLVSRRRGAGTVVASSGLRSNLLRHLDPRLTGPEIPGRHQIIDIAVGSAEKFDLSRPLFEAGHPVARLVRLKQTAEGLPISLERCCVSLVRAPDILAQDLEELTTIAYFNSIGAVVRRANTVIEAVHLDPADAVYLDVTPSTPVLRQRRIVHLGDQVPIEAGQFDIHPTNITLEVSQIDSH